MPVDFLASSVSDLFWIAVIVWLIVYARRKLRRPEDEVVVRPTPERLGVELLARRLDALENRIARLEAAGTAVVAPTPVVEAPLEVPAPATAEGVTAAEAPRFEETPEEALAVADAQRRLRQVIGIEPSPPPAAAEAVQPGIEKPRVAESEFAIRRRELEHRFMENWTGILGAVVVVAGVTFIGIYTALRLQPFYRFLLTLAAAGAFLAVSQVLGRKEPWRDFSAWLRSAGAAILLFACAAAGGLPGLGLQWIHDPAAALGLLVAGIAANLLLAGIAATEVFATLHVLLSLLPLAIVPATTTSLAIASTIAAFGVGFAMRGRWDRHLATVLGAYALFHVLWIAQMGERLEPEPARYFAAGCAAIVFVAAALAHYRKDYAQPTPSAIQLGVHLANWGLLAIAMFAYLPGELVRAGVLVALAVLAYRLGRRARGLRVTWLQQADTLTAQGLVLLALWSGYDLGASDTLLLLVVLAETLAFRRLMRRGEAALLDQVADGLPIGAATLLALAGAADIVARPEERLVLAAMLAAGSALAVLGERLVRPADAGSSPGSEAPLRNWAAHAQVLAFLAGPLLLVALFALVECWWMEAAALGAVSALLLAWRRIGQAGLLAATTVVLVGSHVLSWDYFLAHEPWSAVALAPRIAPLVGLAVVATWLAGAGMLRLVGIVLIGADIGLGAYLFSDPVSPLIPGVTWLILSLGALECANRLKGREALTSLGVGYAYLVAFGVAYALVILQTPAYVGTLRARVLIEFFAIGVLGYWWFFRPREALSATAAWIHVHPLFLELILVAMAVTVVVEVRAIWWAVAWALIALALLARPVERLLDKRARLYSLLFYWMSVGDMAVVMSVMEVPSRLWYEQPEFTSLIAIALQVAYVVVSHRQLVLSGLESPPPVRFLARLGEAVAARRNLYVYYPLFGGIAVFLFWRFDRSLLTLLWSAEAFVVFGLSAWLRENQFRYVALGGLAACLGRLVLIDMAEANLAVRGAVFIGVGLLMLGMNAIYNRYRVRFEA